MMESVDSLTAGDLMSTPVRTCSRFSRVIEAVLIFKDEDCGLVPVVEEARPIGVVTDRDVALALASLDDLPNRPLEQIMTSQVVAVPVSATVDELVVAFRRERLRRLLVLDPEGLLIGIVSRNAVSRFISEGVANEIPDSPESP